MGDYKTILVEKKNNLGYLTLNRPQARNALSREMISEFGNALAEIDKDKDTKVLIVTGAGKAFQAGAAIDQLQNMSPLDLLRYNSEGVRLIGSLERLRQPVIAAVNGPAVGGGLEMSLACTFRVAAESAIFGLPEVKLGLIPGAGGTVRLPRLIGMQRAAEIILTGDMITAKEAERIGLVNKVVPDQDVMKTAEAMAQRIITNAPIAVEMAKNALEVGKDLPLEQAVEYAQKNCVTCFSTEDVKEGTSAFFEKREARFQGR